MKIKLTPMDRLFSRIIKERDKYCQRCGGTGGLQTAHFHSRSNHKVRWDEDNCCLLCFGCHSYLDGHPLEKTEFFKQRLGEIKFDLLTARANSSQKADKELVGLYLKAKTKVNPAD